MESVGKPGIVDRSRATAGFDLKSIARSDILSGLDRWRPNGWCSGTSRGSMSHSDAGPESRDAWDDPVAVASPADVSHIAIILDEYARLCGMGRRPERAEFLARHAAIADE